MPERIRDRGTRSSQEIFRTRDYSDVVAHPEVVEIGSEKESLSPREQQRILELTRTEAPSTPSKLAYHHNRFLRFRGESIPAGEGRDGATGGAVLQDGNNHKGSL